MLCEKQCNFVLLVCSKILLIKWGFSFIRHAGYPDNPSTHGLVAGIWSSLSGAGRFVSRAGTGVLVDHIGFQMTAVVVFSVQIIVVCEILS